MSVPPWLRNESKTKYLWQLYHLNIRIAEIVSNHPKKYRATYGDKLINTALDALLEARIGNNVFVSENMSEMDYQIRRKCLRNAKSKVESIPTIAFIYLELTSKADGVNAEKILKQEEEIGIKCFDIAKMISGVLSSDRKKYNKK